MMVKKGLSIERCSSARKVCSARENICVSWIVVETGNGDPIRIAIIREGVGTIRVAIGSSQRRGTNGHRSKGQ
jgi:hypothetical protein